MTNSMRTPSAKTVISKYHFSRKRTRTPWENGWFLCGAGMSLEYLVILENKEAIEVHWGHVKRSQEPMWRSSSWSKLKQFEGAPNSQRQNVINKNKDSNKVKHIKYSKIHTFIIILKKKSHRSPLEDTKGPDNLSENWNFKKVNTSWGNPHTRSEW